MNKKNMSTVFVLLGLSAVTIAGVGYFNKYAVRTHDKGDHSLIEEPRSFFSKQGVRKEYYANGQLVNQFQYEGIRGEFTDNRGFKITFSTDEDLEKLSQTITLSGKRICSDEELVNIVDQPADVAQKIDQLERLLKCVSLESAQAFLDSKQIMDFTGDIQYPVMKKPAVFTFNLNAIAPDEETMPLSREGEHKSVIRFDTDTKKAVFETVENGHTISQTTMLSEQGFMSYLTDFFTLSKERAKLDAALEKVSPLSAKGKKLSGEFYDQYMGPLIQKSLTDISFGDMAGFDLKNRLVSKGTGTFNLMKGYLSDTKTEVYNQDGKPFIFWTVAQNQMNGAVSTPESLTPVATFKISATPNFKNNYQKIMAKTVNVFNTMLRENFIEATAEQTKEISRQTQELGAQFALICMTGLKVDDFSFYTKDGKKLVSLSFRIKADNVLSVMNFTPDLLDGTVVLYANSQPAQTYDIKDVIQNQALLQGISQKLEPLAIESIQNFIDEISEMIEGGYPDTGISGQELVQQLHMLF